MDSIKAMWAKVAAGLAVILGLVWYYLSLRNKKINSLEAKLDLVDTQKKADVLEADIKQKQDQVGVLKKEAQEHDRLLADLEQKRKDLPNSPDLKPNEVEDYWSKK